MAYQAPAFVDVNDNVQSDKIPTLNEFPRPQTASHSSTPYGLFIKDNISMYIYFLFLGRKNIVGKIRT
jgi:hypothetical protein